MATVAFSRLRTMLGTATGFYFSSTTTSGGTTTTLVDTLIVRFDTAILVNKWVLLTSGTASGEARPIASVSGSTMAVTGAFTATVATSVTYEILAYDPFIYQDALQQAGRTVYPWLWVTLRDETLMVDNLLSNFDFETAVSGGSISGWTNKGTPTLASETSRLVHGDRSLSIVASGATEGVEQDLFTTVNVNEVVGRTMKVRGWLWASVASAVRMRVTFDGSTFTNGPWHAGADEWEGPNLHYMTVTVPADMTELMLSLEVTDGNTGYFDLVSAWVTRTARYTIPTTFIDGPARVLQQVDRLRPDGDYVRLGPGHIPSSGHLLRLEGMGRLTVPTTDSGTVELDEGRAELLIAQAAVYLYRTLRNVDYGSRANHQQDERNWQATVEGLKRQPGAAMKPMSANMHDIWRITEDSSNRYLLLEDVRG